MGLERVVDNIVAKGKADAEATLSKSRKEASEIVKAAEEEAATVKARRAKELADAIDALRRRELAAAELDAKKLRLNAERELLASVRAAVEDAIAKLPEAERKKHLQALVAAANVPNGRVFVQKGDKKTAEGLGLDVAGTFDGIGGVIVQSADGLTTENLRYENLVDDAWKEEIGEVAKRLLGSS